MIRALALGATLILGACAIASTSLSQSTGLMVPQIDTDKCEPVANFPNMVARWNTKFNERIIWFGPSYDGKVTGYLFISPEGGWTMMVTTPDAVCVVTMGGASEFVRPTFIMPGGLHART